MHAKLLLAVLLLVCIFGISSAAPSPPSGTRLQRNTMYGFTGNKHTKRGGSLVDAVVRDNIVDAAIPIKTTVHDVKALGLFYIQL
ncbi:hypothetical protein MBANPS3_009187 [Mucor bainieri]